MTSTPAPAPQKTEKQHTKYVVLEQGGAEGNYARVGEYAATSATAAVRKAADQAGAGTYIAVPARSFQPVKVTVETTKTVKLG